MCSAVVAMLLVLVSFTPTQDKDSGNERNRDAKENSTLFESGEASKLRTPPSADEFRVVATQ